jgi:hypothetical protein
MYIEDLSVNDDVSSEKYAYNCFFGDSVRKLFMVASMIDKRLKLRKKIIEDPD